MVPSVIIGSLEPAFSFLGVSFLMFGLFFFGPLGFVSFQKNQSLRSPELHSASARVVVFFPCHVALSEDLAAERRSGGQLPVFVFFVFVCFSGDF